VQGSDNGRALGSAATIGALGVEELVVLVCIDVAGGIAVRFAIFGSAFKAWMLLYCVGGSSVSCPCQQHGCTPAFMVACICLVQAVGVKVVGARDTGCVIVCLAAIKRLFQ
jgi:hypothetical protein